MCYKSCVICEGGSHIMNYAIAAILMGLAAGAYGADMYRWVDDKGTVNYTPYPPPVNIRNVEAKKLDGGKATASDAPYSVQIAAKNFPVTLYSTPECGDPCKGAR